MLSQTTRFESLALKNYRLFKEKIFAFNPRFNVLIGQNAIGKSTILDALKIALTLHFHGFGFSGNYEIPDTDVRAQIIHNKGAPSTIERFYPCEVCGTMIILDESCKYSFIRGGDPDRQPELALFSRAQKYLKQLQGGSEVVLSVFAYYGVSRANRIDNSRHQPVNVGLASRKEGYADCLSVSLNPLYFSEWLKNITYISLQEGIVSDLMKATLDAIYICLPEVEKIEFRVKEDAVIVSFSNGNNLPFNSLSDGYRSVMALVADIAHRAARLNPHLGSTVAKSTPGVVLIDELDLHLHPKWQRRIVGDLKRAFPLIQFITTTHSPFIIQSLEPGEVIDLGASKQFDKNFDKQSIEDIVEDIMGVPMPQRSKRYQDMYDIAEKYFALLNNVSSADDIQKASLEKKLNELSEPFSDDVAYYAFLNSKRIAAGLNPPSEDKQ